jgi:hypothetical protein
MTLPDRALPNRSGTDALANAAADLGANLYVRIRVRF